MPHRARTRRIAAAIVTAAAVACSSPFSPDRPDVEISLLTATEVSGQSLTMRVAIGGTWSQITAAAGSGSAYATVHAPHEGLLPVHVVLLGAAGDTLASASLHQEFRMGYSNFVSGWVGTAPGLSLCGGPPLVIPTTLSAADTLYIEAGGTPKNVVC